MKKSIILGALAIFAISAMSIQKVEAQEPVKKQGVKTEIKKAEKEVTPATTTAAAEKDVKTKKAEAQPAASDDCCAKKGTKDCKKLTTAPASGKKVGSATKPEVKKGLEKSVKTDKVDK